MALLQPAEYTTFVAQLYTRDTSIGICVGRVHGYDDIYYFKLKQYDPDSYWYSWVDLMISYKEADTSQRERLMRDNDDWDTSEENKDAHKALIEEIENYPFFRPEEAYDILDTRDFQLYFGQRLLEVDDKAEIFRYNRHLYFDEDNYTGYFSLDRPPITVRDEGTLIFVNSYNFSTAPRSEAATRNSDATYIGLDNVPIVFEPILKEIDNNAKLSNNVGNAIKNTFSFSIDQTFTIDTVIGDAIRAKIMKTGKQNTKLKDFKVIAEGVVENYSFDEKKININCRSFLYDLDTPACRQYKGETLPIAWGDFDALPIKERKVEEKEIDEELLFAEVQTAAARRLLKKKEKASDADLPMVFKTIDPKYIYDTKTIKLLCQVEIAEKNKLAFLILPKDNNKGLSVVISNYRIFPTEKELKKAKKIEGVQFITYAEAGKLGWNDDTAYWKISGSSGYITVILLYREEAKDYEQVEPTHITLKARMLSYADGSKTRTSKLGHIIVEELKKADIPFYSKSWDIEETRDYLKSKYNVPIDFIYESGSVGNLVDEVIKNDFAYIIQKTDGRLTIRRVLGEYNRWEIPSWSLLKYPKLKFSKKSEYYSSARVKWDNSRNELKREYLDDIDEPDTYYKYLDKKEVENRSYIRKESHMKRVSNEKLSYYSRRRLQVKVEVAVDLTPVNLLDTVEMEIKVGNKQITKNKLWRVLEVNSGKGTLLLEEK